MKQHPKTAIRSTKQLGAALQRHRKALRMTQAALGERADLRQATISQIERGEAMRTDSLFAVLTALELELNVTPRNSGEQTDIQDIF